MWRAGIDSARQDLFRNGYTEQSSTNQEAAAIVSALRFELKPVKFFPIAVGSDTSTWPS